MELVGALLRAASHQVPFKISPSFPQAALITLNEVPFGRGLLYVLEETF